MVRRNLPDLLNIFLNLWYDSCGSRVSQKGEGYEDIKK